MPTYEYVCGKCAHTFEQYQSIKDDALKTCPKCKSRRLQRVIGAGGGIIFKGSGFYQTDYRSESYAAGQKADAAAQKPAEAPAAATGAAAPATPSASGAPPAAAPKAPAAAPAPTPKAPPASRKDSRGGSRKTT